MNKRLTAVRMAAAVLLLAGCGDQRILERTGFIQSISHDLAQNGKIKYAVSIPIANPDIKEARQYLESEAKSSKEARINLARQTNLLLVSGQLRTALFGMTLSENGLWKHLDTLIRDPTISEQVKFVVVNGDAGDLLRKNFTSFPRTGKYIDRLIEKESKGQTIPETTLYSFTRDYYDDGIDPVAPIIRDEGESIIVDGIGIFRGDKVVGKINPKDSMLFAFLRGSFKQGEVSIDLSKGTEEGKTVMLTSLNSKRKIEVARGHDGLPSILIHVKVKAAVQEYIGELRLSDEADRRKLEQEISKITTKQAERLVKDMQRKKADSLGIGTYVRNSMSYEAWKALNWEDAYPKVRTQCRIEIKIKDYGFRR